MTKSLFAGLAVTALAASSLFAQHSGQIHVSIPFDFAAGVNSLPAGEYFVQMSYSPNAVWIRSADGKRALAVLTHPARSNNEPTTAELVFRVYGDRYFLAQTFTTGQRDGEELSVSHDERELIASRHATKTVTVVASLR